MRRHRRREPPSRCNASRSSRPRAHVFEIELARNPAEREKGLMFRRYMPKNRGMLFDFSKSRAGHDVDGEHLYSARHALHPRGRHDGAHRDANRTDVEAHHSRRANRCSACSSSMAASATSSASRRVTRWCTRCSSRAEKVASNASSSSLTSVPFSRRRAHESHSGSRSSPMRSS